MSEDTCLFCQIVSGRLESAIVHEGQDFIVFLDHRPLFHGHCLVVPRKHSETLADLPVAAVGPFFQEVQFISRIVEKAMNAEGTFVAMNNRVSQSVPHLHVHVVPRKKKDGLKGFFWPRTRYANQQEMEDVRQCLMKAIK